MKRFLVTLFGSFFYTGFFPFAPATFASLVWLCVWLFVPGAHWMTHWAVTLCTVPVAIVLSGIMEKYYGEDAPRIVIDEVKKQEEVQRIVESETFIDLQEKVEALREQRRARQERRGKKKG